MSTSEGPPGEFHVSDVYVKVGDTIEPGQKYLSIGSEGCEGELGIIYYQPYTATVTWIVAKGHEISGPEDWLITYE